MEHDENLGGSHSKKEENEEEKKERKSDYKNEEKNEERKEERKEWKSDKEDEEKKKDNDKERESVLKKNHLSSKRKVSDSIPTTFSYKSSPRHNFKEEVKDKTKQDKKPNAPHYYVSEVNPENHKARYLAAQNPGKKTETPTSNEQTTSRDIPRDNIFLPQFNIGLWAAYPRSIPDNVPACLALLHNTESIYVIQQLNFIELALQLDDEPNLYLVQNNNGQCLYYAYETCSLLGQFCLRGERNLQVHIMDFYNNEVIYINKSCGSNEFFCCYPVAEVFSPPLQPVGAISRRPNPFCALYDIVDVQENKIFKIKGPFCGCYGVGSNVIEFTILSSDGRNTEIGVIKREVPIFSFRNGAYGLSFPSNMDVKMKAILLSAVFFIDYNY